MYLTAYRATARLVHRLPLPTGKLAESVGPLAMTRSLLRGHRDLFRGEGVFLGNEDDFEDLLTFWNLRAAGGSLLFLPRDHIDRLQ